MQSHNRYGLLLVTIRRTLGVSRPSKRRDRRSRCWWYEHDFGRRSADSDRQDGGSLAQ